MGKKGNDLYIRFIVLFEPNTAPLEVVDYLIGFPTFLRFFGNEWTLTQLLEPVNVQDGAYLGADEVGIV